MSLTDWCPTCRKPEAEHTPDELTACAALMLAEVDMDEDSDG